ncbi:MAG: dihydroorotate dehydrogenase electron transfer subunit [Solobacterium sp.]|jgi:dihydroorotate dehydrogenase electron transfer subunit|nr:dihydroorotate dehydrogenase electron transfer subunit [Solobacterium sp.]MCH4221899.1 dihydroorotate dehydrogenase electron transfer subunit [Solobacterium sp.]MCH4265212.1 dihydroorotate dehydrogenase electron transfer subunit [Solobacterium sp.]
MKQEQTLFIESNECIAPSVFKMVLWGDASWVEHPGQFINIAIPGRYLRRPISICDWTESTLTLIYKTVGEGTAQLSQMHAGQSLDVLTGLGNGYDAAFEEEHYLVIGGGVGIPPLYGLTKELLNQGRQVDVILGFNTAKEIFLLEEFRQLGANVHLATADGSAGSKGFVTDVMKEEHLTEVPYMACGPLPMLKAVYHTSNSHGWMSLEERMGCGFGACMGCSFKTVNGYKRICADGPVLASEELPWTTD